MVYFADVCYLGDAWVVRRGSSVRRLPRAGKHLPPKDKSLRGVTVFWPWMMIAEVLLPECHRAGTCEAILLAIANVHLPECPRAGSRECASDGARE